MGLVQYPVRSLCVCVCSRRAILLFDHWNSRHLFHILRIFFLFFYARNVNHVTRAIPTILDLSLRKVVGDL
jgi:hypothetical protein